MSPTPQKAETKVKSMDYPGQIIKSLWDSGTGVETAKVVVAALPEALGRFQILEWVINLGADLRIGSGTENL